MFRKASLVSCLVFALFVYVFGCSHSDQVDVDAAHALTIPHDLDDTGTGNGQVSRRSALKLAAWNIRNLSDASRTDAELDQIVHILIDYDFIAISELRDEKVLKRLQRILSESGAEYDYLMQCFAAQ